jgi:hypothetical protein
MTSGPILVTGAAGLIGGRLVSRLAAEGADVIATDRRAAEAPPGARWVAVDLMDAPALVALMRDARVGAVVHAGAISGPMVAAGNPHTGYVGQCCRCLEHRRGGAPRASSASSRSRPLECTALKRPSILCPRTRR